jgi:predicted HicB family RNase H-like nuclease
METLKDALSAQFLKPQQESNKVSKNQTSLSIHPKSAKAKSKRFNALMHPNMYETLKRIAVEKETSVNDLINQVLTDFVEKTTKEGLKKIRYI